MDSWTPIVWRILPFPPFRRAGRLARANSDNMHGMISNTQPATQTPSDDDPFAPLDDAVQDKPKRKPKYKRRSPAEMAQDAAADAALVKSQAYTPDTPVMRQDKPHRAMRVAYSPMSTPPAQDVPEHVLSIAQGAGVEMAEGDALEDVFGGVGKLSPFALPRIVTFLFLIASGTRHKEAFFASGLGLVDVNLFCRVDKAFKMTYDFAKRMQGDAIGIKVLDAAVERAVDGVQEPITGRIAKDQDGQLLDRDGEPMYRLRYSDRLAETILRATDKRFRDDAGGSAGTGAGTTYNIQINNASPGVASVQDIGQKIGGKEAENEDSEPETIDFSDILDE